MITRRRLIGTSAVIAVAGISPSIDTQTKSALLVVHPSLLTGLPPKAAITESGLDLMRALRPELATLERLEAIVTPADGAMIAQLVRFLPSVCWHSTNVRRGCDTSLGRLKQNAQFIHVLRAS